MNRMFKTQFHNGDEDLKPIVTMSVIVNNGKRFNDLDQEGKAKLVDELVSFRDKLNRFTAEIIMSMERPKINKLMNWKEQAAIDWNKLRDKYFDECIAQRMVINSCEKLPSAQPYIYFSPDELFEWFKREIQDLPLPVESGWSGYDWEQLKTKLIDILEDANGTGSGAIDILEFLQSIKNQSESGWVSVKDRLPENGYAISCLCYDKHHSQIRVLSFNKYHHCWDDESGDDYYTDAAGGKVTHWQPLPEPPKQ